MDNRKLLNEFDEIIKYGSVKLSQSRIKFRKSKSKKRALFFIMGVTQSYSASIFKLLNNPPRYDKAAEVIFRSLFENYINMRFVFSGRNNKNATIFALQSYLDEIRYANRYKDLIKKYPNWDLAFNTDIKTISDWDVFISNQRKQIEKIEKKYKLTAPKKYPDLLDRTRIHDDVLRQSGKLSPLNSLEYQYIYYYKFLSDPAHLNSSGIERFLIENDETIRLDIDAPIENITRILQLSYLVYYIFLKFYLIQFRMFKKEEFKQFDKIRKLLLKKKR